uniref:RING-type domain-containing protein n=1 Tax=Strongyloides venezuelensis TaxID=75913 RepID=A0A0K0G3X9_STRVS
MNALISCNKCGSISSREVRNKFFLLDCHHVLCIQCARDGVGNSLSSSGKTVMCGTCVKTVSLSTIGKDIDEEKKVLFSDPTDVISSATSRIMKNFLFQDRQHEILKSHILKKTQINVKLLKNTCVRVGGPRADPNVIKNNLEKIRAKLREKRGTYKALREKCRNLHPVHVSLSAANHTALKSFEHEKHIEEGLTTK